MHRQYNESVTVHSKKQHRPTRGNNTIPYKFATLITFETLKWNATNVLIVTRDESPLVYRALESASEHTYSFRSASEHSDFETYHIGTSTIRDCTTALFQVTVYRQFARKEQAPIRLYLLLFTPFKTGLLDSR